MRPHAILVLPVVLAVAACSAAGDQTDWQRIMPSRRGPVMSMNNESQEPQPTRAVRLIFEYEGDRVRLVSEQPVDMAVTGFDLPAGTAPGVYVDARDGADRTLARVEARGAFPSSMEVFPENPGEPITRVEVTEPRGAFTVVVPAPDATDHVTILRVVAGSAERAISGAPGAAAPVAEVVDLVSFPIRTGRERREP